MEEIFTNKGLTLIVNNISRFLDPKSLAQCRLTCHSWRNTIDNDRQWLKFQLEHIHTQEKTFIDVLAKDEPKVKNSIYKRFPEWNAVITQFSRKQNILKLKEFVKFMWTYFKDDSMSYYRNPFHNAVAKSNIVFAQLLIDSGIDLEMKNTNGLTPLHFASSCGKIEMVQLLIKIMHSFSS